jgi:hypothetical protein
MVRRSFTLCGFLAFSVSTANAGVVIFLLPQSVGPYDFNVPSSLTFNVDVFAQLDANSPPSVRVRHIQFDIHDTDPAIGVASVLTHTGADAGMPPNGDIYFWDFSSTSFCADPVGCGDAYYMGNQYGKFVDNLVNMTYTGLTRSSSRQITITQAAPKRVGVMQISLPSVPGIYLLDLLNADEPDPYRGARLSYGFGTPSDPYGEYYPFSHFPWPWPTITGGQIRFAVVPEPGTLVLLALGVFSTVVFRRAA